MFFVGLDINEVSTNFGHQIRHHQEMEAEKEESEDEEMEDDGADASRQSQCASTFVVWILVVVNSLKLN